MTCEPYLTRFVSNIRYWFRLTWIIHVSTYGGESSIRKIYSHVENIVSYKKLEELRSTFGRIISPTNFNYKSKYYSFCKNRWTIVLICVQRILDNIWVNPHCLLRQRQFGSLLRHLSERPHHIVLSPKPLECRSITFQLASC